MTTRNAEDKKAIEAMNAVFSNRGANLNQLDALPKNIVLALFDADTGRVIHMDDVGRKISSSGNKMLYTQIRFNGNNPTTEPAERNADWCDKGMNGNIMLTLNHSQPENIAALRKARDSAKAAIDHPMFNDVSADKRLEYTSRLADVEAQLELAVKGLDW